MVMITCKLCKKELEPSKRKGSMYCSGYCKVLDYKLSQSTITIEQIEKRLQKRKETDSFHSKEIQELADEYY